jgi:hypothetical protein
MQVFKECQTSKIESGGRPNFLVTNDYGSIWPTGTARPEEPNMAPGLPNLPGCQRAPAGPPAPPDQQRGRNSAI